MTSMRDRETEFSLPLSPEQLALVDVATASTPVRRGYLLQSDGPLVIPRFIATLDAAIRTHELSQYRPDRVEGFRVPRLRYVGEDAVAVAVTDELPVLDESDAPAAVGIWLRGHQHSCTPDHKGGVFPPFLMVAPAGPRSLALSYDPLLIDGRSLWLLIEQARKSLAEQSSSAPEFQYPQYIEWRRELEHTDVATVGRAYWAEYLGEEVNWSAPVLSYRDGKSGGCSRDCISRTVSADQGARLGELAREAETNVEVLLQAMWWVFLARLTGTDRFLAGWKHDCRADYELMASSIGVFEKILPVLVDVKTDESFSQWLLSFVSVARAHVEQQEHWPLVGASASDHQVVGFIASPGLENKNPAPWQLLAVLDESVSFELALHVAPVREGIEWTVLCDPNLYPSQTTELLAEQFAVLIATLLRDPSAKIDNLNLVGEVESALLLSMNPTPRDCVDKSVLHRIAHWAAETPDASALEGDEGEVSYRDLLVEINRKARWLEDLGVTTGDLVAVVLPRSAALVSTLLAVWQAGAGYLPIEPSWPMKRRLAILNDAKPKVVVYDSLPNDAAAKELCEVALDQGTWLAYSDSSIDEIGPKPNQMAYVLYTSGSTGKPKGVVIEHGQLLNYVDSVTQALQLHKPRRWALMSTVAADIGNTALFGALFNGACLVVAQPEDVDEGDGFSRFIERRAIDAIKIVPSHLEALLESEHARLPATVVLGGESTSRGLLERIRGLSPQTIIHNHYGPTEATVGVMVHTLKATDVLPAVLPLTRVLQNSRIYVLDDRLRLVPAGGRGNVYIGGAQICRGYLNTDNSGDFVVDPFESGARMYRSGDLAYVLPQGGIRMAGRSDDEVKVRGFRVNPAEIEATLLALPNVRQAAVVAFGDAHDASELRAFVVGSDGIDPRIVKDQLSAEIPGHMIPGKITVMDKLQRLPNGKVDRQALRQLDKADSDVTGAVPNDPLELEIATSMAALLERDVLSSNQDFFDLGAHSLMVIKLVARLRKKFDVEIAPAVVFDHTTPAELAVVVRERLRGTHKIGESATTELS